MGDKIIVKGNRNITGKGNVVGHHNVVGDSNVLTNQDKNDLKESLEGFREELAKLNLPKEKFTVANGDVTAAIEEAKKEQPDNKKIQNRFSDVLDTIKEVGKTDAVSKWDWTKKILTILGKIGLSLVL